MKHEIFGKRLCTYCGTKNMYYFVDGSQPIGMCLTCNNTDWCDFETVEDVKKRLRNSLEPSDKKFIKIE